MPSTLACRHRPAKRSPGYWRYPYIWSTRDRPCHIRRNWRRCAASSIQIDSYRREAALITDGIGQLRAIGRDSNTHQARIGRDQCAGISLGHIPFSIAVQLNRYSTWIIGTGYLQRATQRNEALISRGVDDLPHRRI